MEATCSFKKRIGGICSSDKRYEREVVVPLVSCERDISRHISSVGVSDVQSEVELILARASVFSSPSDISTWTICPAHRSSLGIGWRRGANRCRVPPGISVHATKGKERKADRGIGKQESRQILRQTGVFVPVGSGKSAFCITYILTTISNAKNNSKIQLYLVYKTVFDMYDKPFRRITFLDCCKSSYRHDVI